VENSILIGSGSEKGRPYISERSHLYTERGDFKNFHLRVEARINDGGNSGICFRSTFGPTRPPDHPMFPYGYAAQIDSTVDSNRKGSLFAGADAVLVGVANTLVPPGQWFTEEVIAQANRFVIKVNGQKTAEYRDEKEPFGERIYRPGAELSEDDRRVPQDRDQGARSADARGNRPQPG
jgi:hypothetical protein